MSKPPKIDRKTLKQPDTFVQKGQSALDWFAEHRSSFIPFLIAVVVLIAGAYAFDWWTSSRLDDGWKHYTAATKATEPQKWDDMKNVATKWKGQRPGFFAAVALADHYFNDAKKALYPAGGTPEANAKAEATAMTDAATSAEWYSKALEQSDLLPAEKQLLHINRGEALETEKKYDEALADYKLAAEFSGDSKPLALLGEARVMELKNDKAKAAETYERITVDFANTEYAKIAKNLLRRLRSPLFNETSS